tara:strand:+ start:1693 stop:2835 length:1143 start_codon:yes stop_codon:yes gene_type:complete
VLDWNYEQTSKRLKRSGIKGKLEQHQGNWVWRGVCSIDRGPKKQQRIALGIPADLHTLLTAEDRIRTIWGRYLADGTITRPLPWELKALELKQTITVADATTALREQFFAKKAENSSTLNSWKRLQNEMKRMPAHAELTMDLMIEAIHSTKKLSRSRHQACQTYKRVAKLVDLGDTRRIDDLRVTPTPKRIINPPNPEKVKHIIDTLRFATSGKGGGEMWQGWIVAAIASYGSRPSEAFGLMPKGEGTSAHIWTIKRKNGHLVKRTGMLLNPEWMTQLAITDRPELPYEFIDSSMYDPDKCKYYVNQTNRWFQRYFPEHTLYDLRHAWAINAITVLSGNSVLAAKCMGHNHAVHCTTYHAWMQDADVESAVLAIQQRTSS